MTPSRGCVLVTFISAAASIPAPPPQPDPNSAATDKPSRAGRLLSLVRKLIDYAKELAVTSNSAARPAQASPPTASEPAISARSSDASPVACSAPRRSKARIVRGAARLDAARPRTTAAPSQRKSRGARPAPRDNAEARSPLADLPTPEQIAAEVRRRPIGTVIADICRDLGILPSHPLWREIQYVLIAHSGGYARLVKDILARSFPMPFAGTAPASRGPLHPSPAPAYTGPPDKL